MTGRTHPGMQYIFICSWSHRTDGHLTSNSPMKMNNELYVQMQQWGAFASQILQWKSNKYYIFW